MPELPEVETVCRGLAPLIGKTISCVNQRRANLRIPFPDKLATRIETATIISIHRRAKYILIDLDNNQTLIIHLGMSGRVTLYENQNLPTAGKHDHLILTFTDNAAIYYHDPRRFGMVELCPTADLDQHKFFNHLGPEPFSNSFNGPYLYQTLKNKKSVIKQVLLDQTLVCGLGNIYVCEALFHAGIRPTRRAHKITKAESEALVLIIRDVLTKAIEAGGSSLKDFAQANGELGYFQHRWAVYGKENENCPHKNCSSQLKRITQSGRSSFYCPSCQS